MLDSKSDIVTIQNLKLLIILFVAMNLLTACLNSDSTNGGIIYIASRGSAPPAQSIVWSPTDDDKLLITAYETPTEPSKVYVIEIRTKEENILVNQVPASILEAKWTPDGKYALVLSGGDTTGFDIPGWWKVDLVNKTTEHVLGLMNAAWSPDGKTVAALQEEKEGVKTIAVHLVLINGDTMEEQVVATYDDADSTSGLSWSPDGQHLVFSLGDYGFHDLYVLKMGAQEVEKLTENIGSGYPVWSPAGNVIAFERYPSIYLLDVDRKCDVEVPNLENAWSPTWSPDGKKLAYMDRDGIYFLEIDKVFEKDIYQDLCE